MPDQTQHPDPSRPGGDDPGAEPFSWDGAWEALGGRPSSERSVNIGVLALDRHVAAGRGDRIALRCIGRGPDAIDAPLDVTYTELAARTDRFAGALSRHGFAPGAGLATLTGRIPELYVAVLGALKAKLVVTPLFSAFGPDPIAQRLQLGHIRVLVTTLPALRRKVAPLFERLPDLGLVLVVGTSDDELRPHRAAGGPDIVAFEDFAADGHATTPFTAAETPALLHFTSGTTGIPKGAVHVHGAVVAHHATGRSVLDLHTDDVYWCTADPGWVTGTSYGIIAPLTNGVTSIIDEADFDGERWYRILERHRVEVLYTAPTAIRMLQRLGAELPARHDLGALRLVASVGEPLDAEAVRWCQDVFRVPVLDTWWQTETGAIMIANRRTSQVRPGSMGRPVPGIEATLLRRTPDGELVLGPDGRPTEVTSVEESGELAIRAGWPSMCRDYLDQHARYRSAFADGWYRSGDLARRDADGYFWFVGRGDDVIKTSGHLIGPFEVESVLNEHPGVTESGVIGIPDETAGHIIKAFVVPGPDREPDDDLRRDVMAHARRRLGAAVAPREIAFATALPHTRSGKIMRRVLKARELGEAEGDTSTLEQPEPDGGPVVSTDGAPA